MNVVAIVERALITWPETRDSDKKLILAVWWLQNRDYQDNFKEFFLNKAIMPDTITRCRRKLQEQGKYPASSQIEEYRFNKFRATKQAAPMVDAEQLIPIFDN